MNVASSAAVERASGKGFPAEIARELGVSFLVSGTVQGNGDNLRVTVALDDAPAGRRVWAQDFSGLTADLLTIEDRSTRGSSLPSTSISRTSRRRAP